MEFNPEIWSEMIPADTWSKGFYTGYDKVP